MRSERILAAVAVLALGTGIWLATLGSRESERASGEAAGDRAEAAPGLEELALLQPEPEQPRAERRTEGEVKPGLGPRSDAGKATLALRLVARETGQPLPGVSVRGTCGEAWGAPPPSGPLGDANRLVRSGPDGRVEVVLCASHAHVLAVDPFGQAHVRPLTLPLAPLAREERRELALALETIDDLRWFGRVLDDATGAPVAGALLERGEVWPLGAPPPVISGADGVFSTTCASWKEARVRIVHPAFVAEAARLAPGHETPDRAQLIRLARPASLVVRARDGLAAPLAELAVELRFAPSALVPGGELDVAAVQARRGRTDLDGACAFEGLPPRVACEAIVRSPGEPSQRQELELEPGEERELVFEFGGGCTLRGRALDAAGEPLAGLDLWRLGGEAPPGFLEPEHERAVVDKARCDADGRFWFANVPSGTWWVGAAPYARRARADVPLAARVEIAPGERVHELELRAPPGLYIRGRVRAEDAEPVEALVTAERAEGRVLAQSDAAGRFVLGPLPPGEWTLVASPAAGSRPRRFEILGGLQVALERLSETAEDEEPLSAPSRRVTALAGDAGVELALRAGGGLRGVVLDGSGMPVARAALEVRAEEDGALRTGASDADGAFAFRGLLPGRYLVRASAGELVATSPEHVGRGEWSDGLELRLAPLR